MRNVVKPLKGKTMNQFVPKLFDVMKGYSKKQFVNDVIAGIIVAIIALPLSIALALASGVGPEQGIYTANLQVLLFRSLAEAGSDCRTYSRICNYCCRNCGTERNGWPYCCNNYGWYHSYYHGIP